MEEKIEKLDLSNTSKDATNPIDPLSSVLSEPGGMENSHPKAPSSAKYKGIPVAMGFSGQESFSDLKSLRKVHSAPSMDGDTRVEDSSSEYGSELGRLSTPLAISMPSEQSATAIPCVDAIPMVKELDISSPHNSIRPSPKGPVDPTKEPPAITSNWREDLVSKSEFAALCGEQILMHLSNIYVKVYNSPLQKGRLIMSNYQLVFLPEKYITHQPSSYYRVPLATIDRIERDRARENQMDYIFIYTKDVRYLRLAVERKADQAFSALLTYAFPGNIKLLFSFNHRLRPVPQGAVDPGWEIYDAEAEFQRQGAYMKRPNGQPSPWRVSHINRDFSLCKSYPRILVVPADFPEASLRSVGLFRCEGRIPVLSWGRPYDGASIWRSSQPKVGVSGASSPVDEMLLDLIAKASIGTGDGILRIQDCRPRANAMVNRASGFGFESSTNYSSSRLTFMNIGNIHVMRDSVNKVAQLAQSPSVHEHQWGAKIEETGWLTHVRMVISSSWQVAFNITQKASPVLIHCSHGWDRTSQMSALAQIFLDPYFRTCDGFETLICKDWLSFGHPFQLRQCHGMAKSQRVDDQMSPIFLQFLDAVWQLVSQYPTWFEYNNRYLLCIADHLNSCRFGTFLCNNEAERCENEIQQNTASLWTYLRINRKTFTNPLYIPKPRKGPEENHLRTAESDRAAVFLPPVESILRRVKLWADYFLRYSPKASFPDLPSKDLVKHVYGPEIYPHRQRLTEAFDSPEEHIQGPDGVELVDANLDIIYCGSDETEAWLRQARSQAKSHQQQADYQKVERLKQLLQDNNSAGNSPDCLRENDLESKSQSDLIKIIQDLQHVIRQQQQKIEQFGQKPQTEAQQVKADVALSDVVIDDLQTASPPHRPKLFEEYES